MFRPGCPCWRRTGAGVAGRRSGKLAEAPSLGVAEELAVPAWWPPLPAYPDAASARRMDRGSAGPPAPIVSCSMPAAGRACGAIVYSGRAGCVAVVPRRRDFGRRLLGGLLRARKQVRASTGMLYRRDIGHQVAALLRVAKADGWRCGAGNFPPGQPPSHQPGGPARPRLDVAHVLALLEAIPELGGPSSALQTKLLAVAHPCGQLDDGLVDHFSSPSKQIQRCPG